jgi:hypothetical protein
VTRLERVLRAPTMAVGVALVPIVVAVARALDRGWIPMGDNAYFSIRARDVLTEHHPLLGAWSSGSGAVGVDVNNLGPLQLDLLAPFVRLFGFGPGTAIGVAAVNCAAVTAVVLLAHRRLGALGAWIGAAMATALAWTLGSELLFEPRQHHALVLPFLALLVCLWSLLDGDRAVLPATAFMASLLAQTHLTFAVPAMALSVIGVAGAVLATWTGSASATGSWRRWRRSVLVTVLLLAVCWAQPLAEELQDGQGNIGALREAAAAPSDSPGIGSGVRAVATVLAPPAGWWRSSFRQFDPESGLMAPGAAAAAVVSIVVAHIGLLWLARRQADRPIAAGLVTSLLALGVSAIAAGSSPIVEPFGSVSGNLRYLWPTVVFTTVLVVAASVRLLVRSSGAVVLVGAAVVTVVAAGASLPTSYQSPQPEADAPLIPAARALRDQLLENPPPSPVALDRGGLFFGEPYSYVVLAALQEAGVDVVLGEPTDLARFGERRRREGPVRGTVTMSFGDAARAPSGAREVLAHASTPSVPGMGTVTVWFEPDG